MSDLQEPTTEEPSADMIQAEISEWVSRPREERHGQASHDKGGIKNFMMASLGAVGVVFGDIGTSPLYTFSGIFQELPEGQPDAEDLVGAFSLIFWTLTWVTCLKYVVIVMRFSHNGEGGTFALMQKILLAAEDNGLKPLHKRTAAFVAFLGMLGCALLIGDGTITPVMSVLSAVEQVPVELNPLLEVALGIAVLLLLFVLQQCGSRMIGFVAGPIMVLWFLVIAALGIYNIVQQSEESWSVLAGLNPLRVLEFFFTGRYRGYHAWRALAGVVLCVTGAEALYADMGHFGAGPITLAWFGLVYPSLILQYFGQTAFLMKHPQFLESSTANPFSSACPESMRWPLAILSVGAAALASQALISGVFSLISQAHALGFLPRVLVLHTNPEERGQVYIPEVNYLLCIACIVICAVFQNSANLGGAYGISVTGTFVVTTVLIGAAACHCWQWPLLATLALVLPMIIIDMLFWSSNMMKVVPGGWVPLAIALVIWMVMHTHAWGRQRERRVVEVEKADQIHTLLKEDGRAVSWIPTIQSIEVLSGVLRTGLFNRSDLAAVFLTPSANRVPRSLAALAQSFRMMPKVIVLLSVQTDEVPFVAESQRSEFAVLDAEYGLYSVVLHFGYAEPLTRCRLNINKRIESICKEHLHDYPDLNMLLSMASTSESGQGADLELGLASDGAMPMEDTAVQPAQECTEADLAQRSFCENGQGITFILNKLNYMPLPGRSFVREMCVTFYSLLVKNARDPLIFFGLEGSRTLEISSRCYL